MPIARTRRDFLISTAALAVTAPLVPAWGQKGGTVTMGVITPSTGTFAFAGELIVRGANLAIEMHGGKVAGNEIRLLTRDDEGKPASGVRRVQEAATSEGMRYFIGAYSSAVGLAESEVAQREKLLQFAAGGSEDFTGSRCGRYTFQWSAHPYTAVRSTLEYVRKAFPQKKTIYTLTADYVFGHALLKYTKIAAAELGFELVGNDNHPSGERQYTQYLTKVVASRPDILLLNTAGADAVTALRQFASFGAEGIAAVGPWTLEVDQLAELAPEMRSGTDPGSELLSRHRNAGKQGVRRKLQQEILGAPRIFVRLRIRRFPHPLDGHGAGEECRGGGCGANARGDVLGWRARANVNRSQDPPAHSSILRRALQGCGRHEESL